MVSGTSFVRVATLLVTFAASAIGEPLSYPYNRLVPRAGPKCPDISYSSGSGGRKIAIVIDSSGSNTYTDPQNLRLAAAKALVGSLVSNAEATGSKKPDLVTIVDFDDSASVLYQLGDPGSATPAINKIDSFGGTDIASGLKAAINQLTAPGHDPTADRSGIVVLTDGDDPYVSARLAQINQANDAGIRVSFGFLNDDPTISQAPTVRAAILKTGGIFGQITTAASQQVFIGQVLSNGLTNNDKAASLSTFLVAGIKLTQRVDSPGPNKYTYAAQSGESLTFNISPVSPASLDLTATLKDASGKEVGSASTGSGSTKVASIQYKAGSEMDLSLEVSGNNVDPNSDALFEVSVKSSLGVAHCNIPGSGIPSGNGTHNGTYTPPSTPTPTGSPTPTYGPTNPPSNAAVVEKVGNGLFWALAAVALVAM